MIDKIPILDSRNIQEILDELMLLTRQKLPEWNNEKYISEDEEYEEDALKVLHRVFARLMEITIERINKVPEKNRMKFLEIAGIEILPPSPSEAPVIFSNAKITNPVYISDKTQVAAKIEGNKELAIFETQEKLTVVPSNIVRAITVDNYNDRYSVYDLSNNDLLKNIRPFVGKQKNQHMFYLGGEGLIDFGQNLVIKIRSSNENSIKFLRLLDYSYVSEGNIVKMNKLQKSTEKENEKHILRFEETSMLADEINLYSDNEINNCIGRWIQVTYPKEYNYSGFDKNINLSNLDINISSKSKPFDVFYNNTQLDTGGSFMPFGNLPQTRDVFYICSNAFSINNAEVTISIELEEKGEGKEDLEIKWEYLTKDGWKSLNNINYIFDDDLNFKTKCSSEKFEKGLINDKEGYFIRAYISKGNFGKAADFEVEGENTIIQIPSTLKPPIIKNMKISYEVSYTPKIMKKTGNYLESVPLEENVNLFQNLDQINNLVYNDNSSSLYIGFDNIYPQYPVTLYNLVSPESLNGLVNSSTSNSQQLKFKWEYYNGTNWVTLNTIDNTNNFSKSSTVVFLTPVDMKKIKKMGKELFYIRIKNVNDYENINIRDNLYGLKFNGIYLNTVSVLGQVSVENEILGSGNGMENQTLTFSKTPVIIGQEVFVKEDEMPTGVEQEYLIEELGANAILKLNNIYTDEEELWVKWKEVPNFLCSGIKDRHYTLNRKTGEIKFGDGVNGRIMQVGIDNIMANYKYGGGEIGNVNEGAISIVHSSGVGIDKITNPIPAEGGSNIEDVENLKLRGAQSIRNRNCIVTLEDLNWILLQHLGTNISIVKCLPNINEDMEIEAGCITIMVVPSGKNTKTKLGISFINKVKSIIKSCSYVGLGGINLSNINVIGAGYLEVGASIDVIPKDINEAKAVKTRVLNTLNEYFSPLNGGKEFTGWSFGRNVYISELCGIIEALEGVDHIQTPKLNANIIQQRILMQVNQVNTIVPKEKEVYVVDKDKKCRMICKKMYDDLDNIVMELVSFKEGDRVVAVKDFKAKLENEVYSFVENYDKKKYIFPKNSIVKKLDGTYLGTLDWEFTNQKNKIKYFFKTDKSMENDIEIKVLYPIVMKIEKIKKVPVLSLLEKTLENKYDIRVEAFEEDIIFDENTFFERIDNKVRCRFIQSKVEVDQYKVFEITAFNDLEKDNNNNNIKEDFIIETDIIKDNADIIHIKVSNIDTPTDVIHLDKNYLIYSGEHVVNIVN